ncbi:MAG: response regulator transcription factor [Bacteroidota bacterium]
MKKGKILLVEDDPNLGLITQDYLEMIGYEVILEIDGAKGLESYLSNSFDLCILDVMLPKKDGFTLAADIKKTNSDIPIIFLTAKALKDDKITGLKIGADDYITKPFHTEELSLRIEAILKRVNRTKHNFNIILSVGNYQFDYLNLSLKSEIAEYSLTRKEADLLKFFAENINQVVTRENMLKQVWGDDDYFLGRSMDVFISRLRKYLKDDPTILIQNIHGTGFKLTVEE